MIQREDVVTEARKWIDTPYHHQGRLIGVGVDCVGLIIGICEELCTESYDSKSYTRYRRCPPRGKGMLRDLDRVCGEGKETAEPGDIAVFWMNGRNKRAQHLAVVSDYGLIHTHSRAGKVVEHKFSAWWKNRLIGYYNFPEVS